jgi:hypothetical protein
VAKSDGSDKPYKVGRGKPPKHTQYKPGQSGNRNGRRKGSRNFATLLRAELQQRVTVTTEGQRKRITKRELLAKQLVNKAVAGDPKVIPVLLNEIRLIEAIADTKQKRTPSNEDLTILNNVIKRIRDSSGSIDDGSPAADNKGDQSKAEKSN